MQPNLDAKVEINQPQCERAEKKQYLQMTTPLIKNIRRI